MENKKEKDTEVEVKRCHCCGASMKMHWHRISKGLANTLVEFRKEVIKRGRNKIHVKDEVNLSKTAFNNFQKLRYHGLVAKYKNPVTKQHEAGYWLLTRRGNEFCKKELRIPVKVQTFRNKISKKSTEFVYITDVMQGDAPIWDKIDDFGFEFADIEEIEEIKYDKNGQALLF